MPPIRIIYLAHYLRRMDWSLLARFMRHLKVTNGTPYFRQAVMMVKDSLRHNVSPLEVYQFGFPGMNEDQRREWAGTGSMYEFQLDANPTEHRRILNDKRVFYDSYRKFFKHQVFSRQALESNPSHIRRLLDKNKRLVFKEAEGQCGSGVVIKKCSEIDEGSLLIWMRGRGLDLVETYVDQHPDLNMLSPTAVNTVRVVTFISRDGRYSTLGSRLRISVDSPVDNLAAGNLAAPIDEETGIVNGPGVYADITKAPARVHPVTNVGIVGFQIPFWRETLDLVRQASLLHPENRSIGWDVVITPDGPGLIEGNHDWCKLVWQLPVQKGLKNLLLNDGKYG